MTDTRFHSTNTANHASLTITDVTIDDIGTYMCKASNELGTEQCAVRVDVERLLYFPNLQHQFLESPKLTAEDAIKSVLQAGDTLRLAAGFVGTPKPDITWWLNDSDADIDMRVKTSSTASRATIQVSDVKRKDGGVYVVVATNKHGEHRVQWAIDVNGELMLLKFIPKFFRRPLTAYRTAHYHGRRQHRVYCTLASAN